MPPNVPGWISIETGINPGQPTLTTAPSIGNRFKQSMDGVLTKAANVTSQIASGLTSSNQLSFEQWFFSAGNADLEETANPVTLAFFILFILLAICLILLIFFVILRKSKSPANTILLHFYTAQFLFCLSNTVRFIQTQNDVCIRQFGGLSYYAEFLSNPMCQVALCLLAIERLAFAQGLGGCLGTVKKYTQRTCILHIVLSIAWAMLATGSFVIFVVMKYITAAGTFLLKPALEVFGAAKGPAGDEGKDSFVCGGPATFIPIGVLRDLIVGLFAIFVAAPAIVNVLSHSWILTFGNQIHAFCTNQQTCYGDKITRLALLLTISHLFLTLPHILMSVFVSTLGRAYHIHSFFMLSKGFETLLSTILFLYHDPYVRSKVIGYCTKKPSQSRKSPATRSQCDIESLINTVNVNRHDMSSLLNSGTANGTGMMGAGGFANSTAVTGFDSRNTPYRSRSTPPPMGAELNRFRRPSDGFFPVPAEYDDDKFDGRRDNTFPPHDSNFHPARPYFERSTIAAPTLQTPRRGYRSPSHEIGFSRLSRRPSPTHPSRIPPRDDRMSISRRQNIHRPQPAIPGTSTPVMSTTSMRPRSITRSHGPPPIPPRRASESRSSTLLRQQPSTPVQTRSTQRRQPAHSSRRTHSRSASVGAGQLADYRFSQFIDERPFPDEPPPAWGRRPQNWFQSTITNEEEV
ncbi:hypothetical protein ACOME3_000357 [Neoechinorhynchus agilis]